MNPIANSREPEQPDGHKEPSGLQEGGLPARAGAKASGRGASSGQAVSPGSHPAAVAGTCSDPVAGDFPEQEEHEGGQNPSDCWPSAEEQMQSARKASMRYFELPVEIRTERRSEHDRKRELHRATTDYTPLREEMDKLLAYYLDDPFIEQFAREYYVAGASRVLPRMCKERTWVMGEDKRRAELRETIVDLAERLDAIDSDSGCDSAEDYKPRWDSPPPGDNHINRTWKILLQADLRQLSRITARGSVTWPSWLRRIALRAAIPTVLLALSIWSVSATGASAWSAVAWAATLLGVWLTWTTSTGKRDSFVVAVHDIRSDHYHALVEVDTHLRHGGSTSSERKPFTRDPSQRPLTELLKQR